MSKINLSCCFPQNMTLVPNEFVDTHMSRANGEFVKVYLLLLRLSASGQSFSLSDAADRLSCTEKDILRALRYWENTGVLILSRNVRDEISGVAFVPIGMTENEAIPHFSARHENMDHSAAGRGEKQRAQVQPDASAPKDISQAPNTAGSPDSGTGYGRDDKNNTVPDADPKPAFSPDSETGQSPVKENEPPSDSGSKPAPVHEPEAGQGHDANEAAVRHPDEAVRKADANADNTPDRKQLTAARITELENTSDFMYLLFVSGQYLGRNLTRRDIDTLGYFFDELHMSSDLIEYLIEYCVENGHTSIKYIESVGLSWHQKGVKAIEEAKTVAANYQKDYYTILKALGIRDHSPISSEIQIMDKWMNDYRFSMDMIEKACSKTIMTIAKPTIHYTDKILTNWFEKGVRTLDDVKKEEEAHKAKRENEQKKKPVSRPKGKMPSGSFYHFEQRSYGSDLDDMLMDISAREHEKTEAETPTP